VGLGLDLPRAPVPLPEVLHETQADPKQPCQVPLRAPSRFISPDDFEPKVRRVWAHCASPPILCLAQNCTEAKCHLL
jgi:hypothetical protein